MHMQTKQKPVAGLARTSTSERASLYGLSQREYFSLGKFSNDADRFGLKTVGIARGMFGTGCVLQMSGKAADYEMVLDGRGSVLLGKVEANGQRIRLAEGGSNIEATWTMLLKTVETEEKR